MKTLTLFHGSDHIVNTPIYGYGKRTNDYGQGFYCTEDADLAREWSVEENRDGFLNEYSLNTTTLRILDLTSPDFSVLQWITLLLRNRTFDLFSDFGSTAREYLLNHFSIDTSPYDIICGYRADDSYFTYAQNFLNNVISVQTLARALKLGNLGTQIVLVSEKAFGKITFQNAESVNSQIWYPQKEERDKSARATYKQIRESGTFMDDVFLLDIIRGKLEASDVRI